ncbi:MAG: hypothetical protein Q6370_021780 [Candidatus Sigynarchaeota archaeon]
MDSLQYESYYPVVMEMIRAAGIKFMYNGYRAILREVWNLHPWLLLRFETNFIERYCLLPRERVIEAFIGRLIDTGVAINRNVIMTDYRFIVTGVRSHHYWLDFFLADWILDYQSKKAQKTLIGDFSRILEFGFIVPYLYNYELKLKGDSVVYKVDILHNKNGRLKTMKRHVVIRAQKLRSQKNNDFKAYHEELLGNMFNRLSQVQHWPGMKAFGRSSAV